MIFPVGGMLFGVAFGAYRAKMKDGKLLDLLQWGAAYGMIFGVIGLFVLIFVERAYA